MIDNNIPKYQDTNEEEKQLHVRISKEIYMKLKVRCAYEEVSIQDYLSRLIEESIGHRLADGGELLIVEDEIVVQQALKESLKESHSVTTASTAEEALEFIKKQDFDILITDVRLPGKSGLDLIQEVKEMKPYIKCVVITAYPSVELAVDAMKHGAVDYMTKPVGVDDLQKIIWETLLKGRKRKGAGAGRGHPRVEGT